jgi:hypothetical protein
MIHSTRTVFVGLFATALTCSAVAAHASDSDNACASLPTHQQLKVALESARAASNGGTLKSVHPVSRSGRSDRTRVRKICLGPVV